MAIYAVFGATGKCGLSLIRLLLKTPDATVHAYCRNKAKLQAALPEAFETKRLEVFEGQISDKNVFQDCLRGAKAVFLAVSMNSNTPGYHAAQDTTATLISALETLKAEGVAQLPKIIVLSSASLETKLCGNMPAFGHWAVLRANSNIYEDLRVQERMLRAESDWLPGTVFIKPGGLSVDVQRGHKLDLHQQETFISYLDLAAGMIEAAEDKSGQYDLQDVTIQNTNGSARFPPTLPLLCVFGILRHFFPWMHPYLPNLG